MKGHGVFALALCLCIGYLYLSNTAPKAELDFNKLTLIPLDSYNSHFTPPPHNPTQNLDSKSIENIIYFDIKNTQASAHASAIVDISSISAASFMLLYFGGSKEGARDVGIYQSFFMPSKQDTRNFGTWSEPHRLLDADSLSQMSGVFIKKLGNPITFMDTQGRVHIFVVGVSMGGWATSRIYWLMLDRKDLRTLHYVKALYISPFLNISHLVRTPAMLTNEGGFILPIYHELARKYPLLLTFSPQLKLDSIIRPTQMTALLQPSFVPLSAHTSIGIYRTYKMYDNTLFVSICGSECVTKPSNLKNYDSSSVLFSMQDSIFLLHNKPSSAQGNKREELWLYRLDKVSLSDSVVHFKALFMLDNLPYSEVSYPSVAVGTESMGETIGGEFVSIAYTYGRKFIRVAFVPKSKLIAHIDSKNIESSKDNK